MRLSAPDPFTSSGSITSSAFTSSVSSVRALYIGIPASSVARVSPVLSTWSAAFPLAAPSACWYSLLSVCLPFGLLAVFSLLRYGSLALVRFQSAFVHFRPVTLDISLFRSLVSCLCKFSGLLLYGLFYLVHHRAM